MLQRGVSLDQPVLAHLAPEGGAAHAEGAGGFVAAPMVGVEGRFELLPLARRCVRCRARGDRRTARLSRRETERFRHTGSHHLRRQVADVDRLPLTDRNGEFEGVLELADVARPIVAQQGRDHVGGEAQRATVRSKR